MAEVSEFRRDLSLVINHHSREQGSDTPDFILAEYLENCLRSFDLAQQSRDAHRARVASENSAEPRPPHRARHRTRG